MKNNYSRRVRFGRLLSAAVAAGVMIGAILGGGTSALAQTAEAAQDGLKQYTYKVVNAYPHDRQAYTQGLFVDQGALYESTGQYGASSLRRVALETGEVEQMIELPDRYFGEGVVPWDGKIFALTWKAGVGFIFDQNDFKALGRFNYDGEGWGFTHDGERLIMSDGTDTLRFLDPESLETTKRLEVRFNGRPLRYLNELEWVDGLIYANVYTTNAIVMIDPASGLVKGVIDLSGILPEQDRAGAEVLNGVAYDPETERLFVTGKLWPTLFEIELVEKPAR